jgi:GNAT superfamily N-acetyltransferase
MIHRRHPARRHGVRLLLLLLASWCLSAAAPARADQPVGFVHVEGRRFAAPDGHDFALRGISLGNWLVPEGYMFKFHRALSPRQIDAVFRHLVGDAMTDQFWKDFRDDYVTEADIDFLAASGFTTLRVPLHWALFLRDTEPLHLAGPGDALLDRLIGWCRRAGLHVILDLHAAPGGQTGVNHDDGVGFPLTFYVPRYRRETLALWTHLATRYADNPTVLGYDLLNEPISPYADEDYLNPRLEDFYKELATAIRAVDPNHILFLEGAQWSSNFAVFGRPFANNLAYSYHMFWASPVRASIARMLDFANANNVPLLLGETGELSDSWNERFRKLHEKYGVSWSFWTFKTMQSQTTVLSIPPIPGWQTLSTLGDTAPEDWPATTAAARAQALAAMAAYLHGMRFENVTINTCYLRSLGLGAAGGCAPGVTMATAAAPHSASPAP